MYHSQAKDDFNYLLPPQMDMNMTSSESYFDVPSAHNMAAIPPATFNDVANQVAIHVIQECIYFLQNENKFYHVTWKNISQQDSTSSDYHDHEFFYHDYDFSTI